jgi:DNA-binding NtrC family response regulator
LVISKNNTEDLKMNILIIDDEKPLCFALEELFTSEGYRTKSANSSDAALDVLKKEYFDIAILDYQLIGINGLEMLKIIKRDFAWIEVIFITGFGSEKVAIEAIKNGAYDYVKKPFDNDELLNRIGNIKKCILKDSELSAKEFGYYFSNRMMSVVDQVKTVARIDVPVLITGESGTGKELIARLVHNYSMRTGKFIAVNCPAIPVSLIESEFFGSEKGSYTGSVSKKAGFFEMTEDGTLFLDEIGELPYELQSKFLRVIQEKEIIRVGSGLPVKINSRIIAATNLNLEKEIAVNKFREDLYYRLNVINIKLPGLQERKDEIKPLSSMFLKDFNMRYGKRITGFDSELMKKMEEHHWKGNIRELKNKIEKAVIFCKSDIICKEDLVLDDVPSERHQTDTNTSVSSDYSRLPVNLIEAKRINSERFEKEFILHYLEKNNWNVKNTSDEIGLFRQDLYKKIKFHGIKIGE